MKCAKQSYSFKTTNITIQKTDMSEIPHSLFLGNDATCCTALGSCNDWSAPMYIMNKFIQCIEIKDGDKYIGNTMIYPIRVAKNKTWETAIMLDNIEIKPPYQYNEEIEKGIIKYTKMLLKDIGLPDADIFAGPYRHKLDMKNFTIVNTQIAIAGDSGENKVYIDFCGEGIKVAPDDGYTFEFYKLNK